MNHNLLLIQEAKEILSKHGREFLSYENKKRVHFRCKCGTVRVNEFGRLGADCKTCMAITDKSILPEKEFTNEETGEVWKAVRGGLISSFGNAMDYYGRMKTLSSKDTYFMAGAHEYIGRLMATAFQIKDYEKLSDGQSHIVSRIDKNMKNNHLSNFVVESKKGKLHGKRKNETKNTYETKDDPVEKRPIFIAGKWYYIYRDGRISNEGGKFLKEYYTKGYRFVNLADNTPRKFHRLVCFVYHPIEGRPNLEDYSDLQVNHIDGDKTNNSADNLEWVTQNENMRHAHDSGLNRISRRVAQIDLATGNVLQEFKSLAEASRQTGEPEHVIRDVRMGRNCKSNRYGWRSVE